MKTILIIALTLAAVRYAPAAVDSVVAGIIQISQVLLHTVVATIRTV